MVGIDTTDRSKRRATTTPGGQAERLRRTEPVCGRPNRTRVIATECLPANVSSPGVRCGDRMAPRARLEDGNESPSVSERSCAICVRRSKSATDAVGNAGSGDGDEGNGTTSPGGAGILLRLHARCGARTAATVVCQHDGDRVVARACVRSTQHPRRRRRACRRVKSNDGNLRRAVTDCPCRYSRRRLSIAKAGRDLESGFYPRDRVLVWVGLLHAKVQPFAFED